MALLRGSYGDILLRRLHTTDQAAAAVSFHQPRNSGAHSKAGTGLAQIRPTGTGRRSCDASSIIRRPDALIQSEEIGRVVLVIEHDPAARSLPGRNRRHRRFDDVGGMSAVRAAYGQGGGVTLTQRSD